MGASVTRLTAKQENFCLAYVSEKMTASDAYRMAYDTTDCKPATINRQAHALLRNSKIAARIAELRAAAAEAAKVTLEGHLQDLLDLRDKSAAARDYGPAVRAEIARAQAAGLLEQKVAVTHTGGVHVYLPSNGRDADG